MIALIGDPLTKIAIISGLYPKAAVGGGYRIGKR